MAVLQPRMRVVMFRISDSEHELIQNACSTSGARSFSDFARSAVLCQARGSRTSEPEANARGIADLQARVHDLERRLDHLMALRVLENVAPESLEIREAAVACS